MRVIVATYTHRHGDDLRVFASDEGAERWRQEIAATYWNDIMDGDMPKHDPGAAANMYFDRSGELGDEFFGTDSLEVEGLKVEA